jgi:serine protease Do
MFRRPATTLALWGAMGSLGCAAANASTAPTDPAASTGVEAPRGAARHESTPASPVPLATVTELERAFQRAASTIAPSVVSITSARPIQDEVPEFLRPFAAPDGQMQGIGSGVIIDEQGYIITNNHVVEGSTTLRVRLDDDREYEAEIVGVDPKTDLSVIRIDAPRLVPATLGRSEDVTVGQWVIAAGSPFGLPRTVTAGIVSATGRGSMGIADYGDFIQTDAAVNQGNSGGPLIDLSGRVIGINTAIASSGGGSNGIGFAIPMDLARGIVDQLIVHGSVERGWLGIVMGKLTPDLAKSFDFEGTRGILINDVDPKGPAARDGLRVGDIVDALDGNPVRDMSAFRNAIAQRRPGTEVQLRVWREGASESVAVRLGALEPASTRGSKESGKRTRPAKAKKSAPQLGLLLEDPPPELRRRLGLGSSEGAMVADIARGSAADGADLRPGDVIVSIDGHPVKSVVTARRWLQRADLDEGIRIRVRRGRFGHFTVLRK